MTTQEMLNSKYETVKDCFICDGSNGEKQYWEEIVKVDGKFYKLEYTFDISDFDDSTSFKFSEDENCPDSDFYNWENAITDVTEVEEY